MRLALISDLHSNIHALRAVIADVRALKPDQVFCLGDTFGYYPWASETFDLLQSLKAVTILGNHDRLVLETLGLAPETSTGPRPSYYEAARQNGRELSEAARSWLASLPLDHSLEAGGFKITMVHGTPPDPLEGRFYPDDKDSFDWFPRQNEILILGHTHYPIIRRMPSGGLLLNPGSVGQPRDGDPRPSWMLLEINAEPDAALRRVQYDQFAAMAELERLNWPPRSIAALNKTAPGPLVSSDDAPRRAD